MHTHDHNCGHDHGDGDGDESPSTGFLPMGLAVGLFVIGLFALGYVRCSPSDDASSGQPDGYVAN